MTIKTARKYLPNKFKNLSDEEVLSLVSQLEILAEIFIETFDKNGSKKQLGVIDSTSVRQDNEEIN